MNEQLFDIRSSLLFSSNVRVCLVNEDKFELKQMCLQAFPLAGTRLSKEVCVTRSDSLYSVCFNYHISPTSFSTFLCVVSREEHTNVRVVLILLAYDSKLAQLTHFNQKD